MKPHILVVDDNRAIREVVSFILGHSGYETSEAGDGEEALAKIVKREEAGTPFDLLVTDIQMPRMSGEKLIEEVRKKGLLLPIIVISGLSQGGLTEKMRKNGCSDFFPKPFDVQKLLRRMGILIRERRNETKPGGAPPANEGRNHPACALS